MSAPRDELKAAVARKGSLLQTLRAVAWSFFGVRRASGLKEDVERLNPLHVVIVGLVLAAGFVLTLVLVVRWILSSGLAAG